jgi:hypothetical protein
MGIDDDGGVFRYGVWGLTCKHSPTLLPIFNYGIIVTDRTHGQGGRYSLLSLLLSSIAGLRTPLFVFELLSLSVVVSLSGVRSVSVFSVVQLVFPCFFRRGASSTATGYVQNENEVVYRLSISSSLGDRWEWCALSPG